MFGLWFCTSFFEQIASNSLIPYSRYFFTLIPHPTLVYVSSLFPGALLLFRILFFLFPNPRRTLKKTDFDAKANKCKIWIGPYDVKAIP